jgi:hypothetical protein
VHPRFLAALQRAVEVRHCLGREPLFLAVKHPARPYRTAIPPNTDLLRETLRVLNRPGRAWTEDHHIRAGTQHERDQPELPAQAGEHLVGDLERVLVLSFT